MRRPDPYELSGNWAVDVQVDQLAPKASEMSLRDFVESTWFKGLSRGAMIVGAAIASYAGVTLANINTKQDTFASDLAAVKDTQGDRATDQERFQKSVDGRFSGLEADVDKLTVVTQKTNGDVATVKGILMQMQRETDIAESQRLTRDLLR